MMQAQAKVNPQEHPSATPPRRRGIDSVEVAGTILKAAVRLDSVFRLKDLELATSIASATLYRYLVSLMECGLIQRVEGSNRYTLGLLAFQLGQKASQSNDVVSLIAPHVQEFSQAVGETCAIGVWFDGGPIMVKWFEVNRAISISLRLGAQLPLLASSTAKVFGAYLPRAVTEPVLLRELLAAGRKPGEADAYYASLKRVRDSGIAQGLGTHIKGISSLSAPVFDQHGRIVVALAVIGNQMTFDAGLNGQIAGDLKKLAARLSAFLGATA
jgi:DNA-binding IclR family transcriptional regulator